MLARAAAQAHPLFFTLHGLQGQLNALRPASPAYFDPQDHKSGQFLVSKWNVMVPNRLMKLLPDLG